MTVKKYDAVEGEKTDYLKIGYRLFRSRTAGFKKHGQSSLILFWLNFWSRFGQRWLPSESFIMSPPYGVNQMHSSVLKEIMCSFDWQSQVYFHPVNVLW